MNLQKFDLLSVPLDRLQMVEASAGTGKTWTLCGLYLRLLLEKGLEVPQILVVTFTNAASAELRDRIRARLVEARDHLRRPPSPQDDPVIRDLLHLALHRSSCEEVVQRLDLALATFDEAAIFTIHGFCRKALADTPFSAHVPAALELVHDDSAWCLQVAADHWRSHLGPGCSPPPALVAELARRRDSPETLARELRRHQALRMSQVRWPADLEAGDSCDPKDLQVAHDHARHLWQVDREAILQGLHQALERGALRRNIYKAQGLEDAAAQWDLLLAQADASQALASIDLSEKSERLPLLGLNKLQASKTQAGELPTHAFHLAAQQLLALHQSLRADQVRHRLRFLRDFLQQGLPALASLKQSQHIAAFDDLLSNLHTRLHHRVTGPALQAALRQRFPAALIDEFQDTDPLQWSIFKTLYHPGEWPVFLVGDPKQAIYSFRNADLHTYLQARSHTHAQYTLTQNQRSTQALIDALNGLFQANPRAFMMDGLDYPAVSMGHRPRKILVDPEADPAAFQVWWLGSDPHTGDPWSKSDAESAAAQATAREIARLLQAGHQGRATLGDRSLQGRDVAVLVRSHREGTCMREALAQQGVASVEMARASIFDTDDALALETLLTAVLDPAREARLKAALSTDWIGLDAQTLDALSHQDATFAAWTATFHTLRDDWRNRGVGFMLCSWMESAQISTRLLAQSDGERRMTNVGHLLELLHEAAQVHTAPEALLGWLKTQRHRAREGEEPADEAQLRLESDRNLVQIVTIHKSKGLEYPVVFCPFAWKGETRRSAGTLDGLRLHAADGQNVIDYRLDGDPGFDAASAKSQIQRDDAAESLRLLYVALTRAAHRCVVVAGPYTSANSTKESGRALLNWWVAGAGHTPQSWLDEGGSWDHITASWQALVQRHPACMSWVPWTDLTTSQAPVTSIARQPKTFSARLPASVHPRPWRMGSYSGLVHSATHEGAAVDHDARVHPPPTDSESQSADPSFSVTLPPEDCIHFPKGAQAGQALHTLLESIDFADDSTWDAALDRMASALPPRSPAADGDGHLYKQQAKQMLQQVLQTPLPFEGVSPLTLAQLSRERRAVELEFHLPSPRLEAPRLQALLEASGYPAMDLNFAPLTGYLKGYIDLVFEHEGRFFVLDWKSNFLGTQPLDYHAQSLNLAMSREGYHLQALLYSVAIHRWLKARWLHYDPIQHWGGVVYLFVRGVRPGWTDPKGQPAGMYFNRPSPHLLEQLSKLFAASPPESHGRFS